MKIIISGGGSGGHIFPAVAIAQRLKHEYPTCDILFVGAEGKMEMEKVPKAGFPIKGLWISGLQRRLTLKNLLFPLKLLHSQWRARSILKSFAPQVVVGVGGYASAPTLRQAAALGIPTLIQEQNSYAGIANKWLSKKVTKICVAYDQMDRFFPKDKIVLTGNPIRMDLLAPVDRVEASRHFGLDPQRKTILVVGGSLGARSLNAAMKHGVDAIGEMDHVQWLWQMGGSYSTEFSQTETAALRQVHAVTFIDRMDWAYASADLVIGRAGALTISEICALGKAAILVPSPHVAEDHQTKNAQALVEKDAALLIEDKDAPNSLIPKALEVIANDKLLQQLRFQSQELAKPEATKDIVEQIHLLTK